MFSPALEAVLHIAMREAISRRHAYLTVEHLLYALAIRTGNVFSARAMSICRRSAGRSTRT